MKTHIYNKVNQELKLLVIWYEFVFWEDLGLLNWNGSLAGIFTTVKFDNISGAASVFDRYSDHTTWSGWFELRGVEVVGAASVSHRAM